MNNSFVFAETELRVPGALNFSVLHVLVSHMKTNSHVREKDGTELERSSDERERKSEQGHVIINNKKSFSLHGPSKIIPHFSSVPLLHLTHRKNPLLCSSPIFYPLHYFPFIHTWHFYLFFFSPSLVCVRVYVCVYVCIFAMSFGSPGRDSDKSAIGLC